MKKLFALVLSIAILASNFVTVSYAKPFDEAELDVLWLDTEYYLIGEFHDGLAEVMNEEGKEGFINTKGEVVIPLIYEMVFDFMDGVASVYTEDDDFHINTKGEKVNETRDYLDYDNEGMETIYNDDYTKMGYKNAEGVEIIAPINFYVGEFHDGIVRVQKEEYGPSQYYDKAGKLIVDDEFDSAYDFNNGLAGVMKNGIMGAINTKGEVVIPFEYQWIGKFSEGLIPAKKYINGDVLAGFINEKNEVVVPFVYVQTDSFSEGLAIVYKGENYEKQGILKNPLLANSKEDKKEKVEETKVENPSEGENQAEVPVKYSKQNMTLDGKALDNLEAYLIDGHNYFKLRDIAKLADGTNSKFAVNWNADKKMISLVKGQAYVAAGTELTGGDGLDKTGVKSTFPVEVDGIKVELDAYNINGQTYYQIRDLGEALDFVVDWDNTAKTVVLKMN